MSATNTLDGMTTQQLQELVERAQATIKAQAAKNIITVGGYSYHKSVGKLYFTGRFAYGVSLYNQTFVALVNDCINAKDRVTLGELLVAIGKDGGE